MGRHLRPRYGHEILVSGYPVLTDYGHLITKFLGWVDLLSYGAPTTMQMNPPDDWLKTE